MTDKAASVLAKLKNKAKISGISYQQCLQLFMQEEFLRKLSKSGYEDNLILKGGLFIYALTNFESRATIDVDFLLRGVSNSIEDVKSMIGKIIETLKKRETPYDRDSFKRILSLSEDEDMQKRWRYFLKNIKNDTLEFAVVIKEMQKFLEPVFDAIVDEEELDFQTEMERMNKGGYRMGKVLELEQRGQAGSGSYNRFEYQVHWIVCHIISGMFFDQLANKNIPTDTAHLIFQQLINDVRKKSTEQIKTPISFKSLVDKKEIEISKINDKINVSKTFIKLRDFVQVIDHTGSETPRIVYMYQSALYLYKYKKGLPQSLKGYDSNGYSLFYTAITV